MPKYRIADEVAQGWWIRIRHAEGVISSEHRKQWDRVLAEYRGRNELLRGGLSTDEENFNYLLATANTMVPAIATNDPYARVTPRRSDDVERCRTAEAVINSILPKMGLAATGQEVELDQELFGVGVFVVEMPSQTGAAPIDYDTGPEKDGVEKDGPLGSLDQDLVEDEMIYMLPLESPPEDDAAEMDRIDLPSVSRIAPWDLLVPEGYSTIGRCPWVAHRRAALLDDLRADRDPVTGRARFRIPAEAKPNRTMAFMDNNGMQSGDTAKPDAVTIFEIRYWTRKRDGSMCRRVLILMDCAGNVTESEKAILHIDDPAEMRGYPYVVHRTVIDPLSFYPSSVAPLGSVQGIATQLNATIQSTVRHIKRASKQKYLTAPGMLNGDSQVANLLGSEADLEAAESNFNGPDIRAGFALVPIAPLPNDVPFLINTLQRHLYEMSGVDAYQRGGQSRKGTTATEVAVAAEGTRDRAQYRRRKYEQALAEVAAKVIDLCRQFWTRPVLLRVAGSDGDGKFITVSGEDLPETFDVTVDVGSTAPMTNDAAQGALAGLVQTLALVGQQLMPLEQAGIIPAGTTGKLVEQAVGVFNTNHRLIAGPMSELVAALGGGIQAVPGAAAAPESIEPSAPEMDAGTTNPFLAGSGPRPRPGDIAGA